MNLTLELKAIYFQLIAAAYTLAHLKAPMFASDSGPDRNWSGTAARMTAWLHRDLSPAETHILSLSRRYGPMPMLAPYEADQLQKWLEGVNPDYKHLAWEQVGDGIYFHWEVMLRHHFDYVSGIVELSHEVDPDLREDRRGQDYHWAKEQLAILSVMGFKP